MRTARLSPVLALMVVVSGQLAGCEKEASDEPEPTPTPVAPAPPLGKPIADLVLFDGWSNPRSLPAPVNTLGWEDSSFISPDGTTLYFGYTRYDFTALATSGTFVVTGPSRPGEVGDAFDIYEARIENGAWVVANSTVNDPADISEAAQGVDAARDRLAFVRFENTPQYNPNIYTARWDGTAWADVEKLPPPVNTDCPEDNVHISADGRRLYFDSSRADAQGTGCTPDNGLQEREIWVSTRSGESWGTPEKVTIDFTSPVIHWQPFEDAAGENLYWSGAAIDCPFGCLYKAPIAGGEIGTVEKIMEITTNGNGHVNAIGEMSITADGRFLYFTYAVLDTAGVWDVNIGVAER